MENLGLESSKIAPDAPNARQAAAAGLPALAGARPPVIGERIAERFGSEFDVVLVMRSYLAGVALPFIDAGIPAVLDADDDEVLTRRSMASFVPGASDEADRYDAYQQVVLPWFRRVLFASREDAREPWGHLPNAVELPDAWCTRTEPGPLELLFVGAPSYAPNRDARRRLEESIVPALTAAGTAVQLHLPGVEADTAPIYARAHVAVVPLRAGGGTRIKVLEAFAHGCPVVATPTGARGLGVRDDVELVITARDDDDIAFARAVASLGSDPVRRHRLAAAARRLVAAHHTRAAVGAQLAATLDAVIAGR